MALDGFDKIANIYDGLARLVFGKAIKNAQLYYLDDLGPQAKVLMLGGGTGWLLSRLLALKPDCEVWYVEASHKMLELSKVKTNTSPRVHFIHGTETNTPSLPFDAVITNFYLDLFPPLALLEVSKKIQSSLRPGALWIATDFVNRNKWWQTILLKVMYVFFRVTCGIHAKSLPEWNQTLVEEGLDKEKSKFFFGDFIEATVYRV